MSQQPPAMEILKRAFKAVHDADDRRRAMRKES